MIKSYRCGLLGRSKIEVIPLEEWILPGLAIPRERKTGRHIDDEGKKETPEVAPP
jgi:hypothetical protein